ncbi:MAG: hypothetical protein AAF657_21270 [Acidobacteriota bacterium]
MSRLILLPRPTAGPTSLLHQLSSDDVLLPLTVEGLARYSASAQVASLETLIPYERLCALARQAHQLLAAFAAPPSGPARIDGVDWNRLLLSDSQLFYFRDLMLGQAMAEVIAARRFERVVWIGNSAYPPHLAFHAFLQTLRVRLGHLIEVWDTSRPKISSRFANARDRLSRFGRRLRARVARLPTASTQRPIIAIFATTEWQRFTEPLARIHQAYGARLQLWYLGPATDDLQRWASDQGLSISSLPYPQTVDRDIAESFAGRLDWWRQRDREELSLHHDCPGLTADALDAHFRALFTYTMPRLAQWGRALKQSLEAAKPSLVLGSAAFNASSAFPWHIAKALGLTTLALPHTYVPGDHTPVASTYLACRSRFERANFSRSFPDDERVVFCADAANALSYRPEKPSRTAARRRRVVALLTSSPTTDGLLLPIVDTGAFVESLRALLQPPADLDDLQLVIKSHPRYDVVPLIREHLDSSPLEVFPATAGLTSLLEEAWVVVLCDHYGSVAVEAAMTGKPLVYLDSASFTYPGVDLLALDAAEKVASVEELWRLLRRLSSTDEAFRTLRDRCQEFGRRHLQAPETPLVQTLRKIEPPSDQHA